MTVRLARRGRRAGFSLLETVVALVIFGAAGTALFTLFNTNLIALARAEAVSAQVPVVRAALTTLSAVNPAERQAGRFAIDGHEITWTAALVAPMRPARVASGLPAGHQLGLYEIAFRIAEGGRPLGTWRVRQVGFHNTLRQGAAR